MLIVHLFVSYAHVNLCHFFSSSWCRGLAALFLRPSILAKTQTNHTSLPLDEHSSKIITTKSLKI